MARKLITLFMVAALLAVVVVVPAGAKVNQASTDAPQASTAAAAPASVSGTVKNAAGQTGTFTGNISNLAFTVSRTGTLVLTGVLNGTATINGVTTRITDAFFSAATRAQCDILKLDIGAIHLDLLGLVIDISPIHISIVAVPGPGNLLGNLLCALVGLLDNVGGNTNGTRIASYLRVINSVLR